MKAALQEEWRGEIVQLSWQPRAYQLKGFLRDEECDHLIKLAQPTMRKSSVADSTTGKSIASEVRTSTGTFLAKHHDEIVRRLERRVAQVRSLMLFAGWPHCTVLSVAPQHVMATASAANLCSRISSNWKLPHAYQGTDSAYLVTCAVGPMQSCQHLPHKKSGGTTQRAAQSLHLVNRLQGNVVMHCACMQVTMIPEENQEGLQILHYQDGQKYEPHHDYFHDQINQAPSKGASAAWAVHERPMHLRHRHSGMQRHFLCKLHIHASHAPPRSMPEHQHAPRWRTSRITSARHHWCGQCLRSGTAGGQRVATVLMYLTTPLEGGETVFPHAERNVTGPQWSECAKRGLGLKAVKGDALMFFSLRPDGSEVSLPARMRACALVAHRACRHLLRAACCLCTGRDACRWHTQDWPSGRVPCITLHHCDDLQLIDCAEAHA